MTLFVVDDSVRLIQDLLPHEAALKHPHDPHDPAAHVAQPVFRLAEAGCCFTYITGHIMDIL